MPSVNDGVGDHKILVGDGNANSNIDLKPKYCCCHLYKKTDTVC